MTKNEFDQLPAPVYARGTKAITLTPVVGTPRRKYAEMYLPGEEELEDGEIRVTVLGSGNPWPTRAQASGSVLVEIGNPERDVMAFDLGTGSLSNYASLKLPVNKLNKVFITHLRADHMGDLITLSGSFSKVGRTGLFICGDRVGRSRDSVPQTLRKQLKRPWRGTRSQVMGP